MMADSDSRKVDYNEEYVPARFYKKICDQTGVYPTVDMMASSGNRRTKKFVNRGPTNHEDAIAFDVFSVEKKWVDHETLYFFPPKSQIQQVLFLITTRFMDFKCLVIIHLWEEYPKGFARLISDKRVKMRKWKHAPLGIIPDDKVLWFDNKVVFTRFLGTVLTLEIQKYAGFWNTKPVEYCILTINEDRK